MNLENPGRVLGSQGEGKGLVLLRGFGSDKAAFGGEGGVLEVSQEREKVLHAGKQPERTRRKQGGGESKRAYLHTHEKRLNKSERVQQVGEPAYGRKEKPKRLREKVIRSY